eukprot:TRINITY_DN12907_c0_g1_i1.p1 TRINITY_DN12907_c0_g1~~TRINITY_DN12907_c0_g1_i1.p1  ORF type:complete len:189 (-),score=38.66 TRINITY_DN12907_c0_g1_i1:68-634(-)
MRRELFWVGIPFVMIPAAIFTIIIAATDFPDLNRTLKFQERECLLLQYNLTQKQLAQYPCEHWYNSISLVSFSDGEKNITGNIYGNIAKRKENHTYTCWWFNREQGLIWEFTEICPRYSTSRYLRNMMMIIVGSLAIIVSNVILCVWFRRISPTERRRLEFPNAVMISPGSLRYQAMKQYGTINKEGK